MSHLSSIHRKKNIRFENSDLTAPREDIVFLESDLVTHYNETAISKITGAPPIKQSTHSPSSEHDPLQSFEVFPDFTKDRSQHHYLVSPEPPLQRPLSDEAYFPVIKSTSTEQSKSQAVSSGQLHISETDLSHEIPFHISNDPPLSVIIENTMTETVFSPPEDQDLIDSTLLRIIRSEPLLSENELIVQLEKASIHISQQSLIQALIRNDLDTDYKRFTAYMAG